MIRTLVVALLVATYIGPASDPTADGAASVVGPRAASHLRVGARHSRASQHDEASAALQAALDTVLDPAEPVERIVAAVGCTLVLTDRRLVLVRDRADRRPTSGVVWWTLDRALNLHLGPVHHDTDRLVIEHHGRTTSVFLATAHMGAAVALVARVRQRIYADG